MPLPFPDRRWLLGLCLGLAACAPLPDFSAFPEKVTAPPPALMPLDQLLAQAAAPTQAETRGQSLQARASRLKARAALMRGPVMDPATRARLAAAIARGGA